MATKKTSRPRVRPALDPDARENQLIDAATALAEEQILNGTAKSQVITHYLKLGAQKNIRRLEEEKMELEMQVLQAKTELLQSQKRVEELYTDAINAMKRYSGNDDEY